MEGSGKIECSLLENNSTSNLAKHRVSFICSMKTPSKLNKWAAAEDEAGRLALLHSCCQRKVSLDLDIDTLAFGS